MAAGSAKTYSRASKSIKMITKFQGESRKQAIVNHFSLDIEEERLFISYIGYMGYTIDSDDDIIENLHAMWEKQNDN